jgi:hypothetical protein
MSALNPRALQERTVPFVAGDGFQANLINVKATPEPPMGPVILVHGAGVRANIFRAPVAQSIVDYLAQAGYDVWLENWRASIDLPPNHWTLDQAALYDHPAAVRTVLAETGREQMKAIIHCQGSTSFMMSAVAGLVPQVTTIVTNAVSLHPIVPPLSRFKLRFAIPLFSQFTDYFNPHWGDDAPTLFAKFLNLLVALTHHECDNPVCKQVSITYGSGFPALWRHENLNNATHQWLRQEFGHVPLTFFHQIAKSVARGHLLSVEGQGQLPEDFVSAEPATDARFAFFGGAKNLCFLPESQQRTFELFDRRRPGYHSLHIFRDYGHLDVFMGKDAARDTFPLIAHELERQA